MKKFLDDLNARKEQIYESVPITTDATRINREMRQRFSELIGKRALFTSKVDKDSRVVTIKEVCKHYVRVSYKYYGMDYKGELNTCVTYLALYCGDDRLDVE